MLAVRYDDDDDDEDDFYIMITIMTLSRYSDIIVISFIHDILCKSNLKQ